MEYEEYMRSVLGYHSKQENTYSNEIYDRNNYQYNSIETEELNRMYPDIYKVIYPMVCKVCNENKGREINEIYVEEMTDKIYNSLEETRSSQNLRAPLKNGDVRNPNAKEPEVSSETRQRNFLLRDLIKILILRELGRPNRPPMRPPYQPPRPPRPPRPPMW